MYNDELAGFDRHIKPVGFFVAVNNNLKYNDSMLSTWDNPLGFIINLVGVAIGGFFVYIFNYGMLRKNETIGDEVARFTAMWMAIITAPYLIMIPIYFY